MTEETKGHTPIQWQEEAEAHFEMPWYLIVKACNAYDKHLEVIRGLVEALEQIGSKERWYNPYTPIEIMFDKCVRVARNALAKAEKP